jgi:RNA polymerase sigma-70 factor (ECF subfamily)
MRSLVPAQVPHGPHAADRPVASPDKPVASPDKPVASPARSWADFENLYREHFAFVWRTVRRLGAHPPFVEDVTQEVFVVVHRRLDEFEGRSPAKTWLYGIVRRVVADHRRTLRRKPLTAGASTDDAERPTSPEEGPDASAERAERVQLLHRLLAGLDESKREVFILAELEGLTLAEISEALGVNQNTVASRLRAARREFEVALDQATDEDDAPAEPRQPAAREQRES